MKQKILQILNNNSDYLKDYDSLDGMDALPSKNYDKVADEILKLIEIEENWKKLDNYPPSERL